MNFLKKEKLKGVTLLMQNKEDFLGTEPIGKHVNELCDYRRDGKSE